jgi:catechol 2,3-dioxygenase-like lactoylglutathione lyase family enzyme
MARKRSAKSKTARASTARRKAAAKSTGRPRVERRKQQPQTLRLRKLQPTLTVNDLQKSLRFYTDVLGFIVGERWTSGSVLRGVLLKAGVCEIGLSQDDGKKGLDREKGVGFRIYGTTAQDIDALADRINAAGGVLTDGPKDESWGGRSLSVDDPDGFHLTIYRET